MTNFEQKTYAITSAQGIQSPYSAKTYGPDRSKGKPIIPLIENIERYVKRRKGELRIHAIPGANVNEIELHPYFADRKDLWMDEDSKIRNEQNKAKETAKREKYLEKVTNKVTNENKAQPVTAEDCPYNPHMHYFWGEIPNTEYRVVHEERLNKNIHIRGVPIRPQNKNPFTGNQSLTKNFGGNSVIIPSPKKIIEAVAQGEAAEYPHLLMTTASCTEPNYNFGDLGFKAKEDHEYGFTVVDVINQEIFLSRIVPANKNGTFIDLGIKYSPENKPHRANVIAMVIGDSHVIEINPKVDLANKEMIRALMPKNIHFNDVFAAKSINIHESSDYIARARMHRMGLDNLEKELIQTGEYIAENSKLASEWGGEVIINYSNHDDMLYRWLSNEEYRKDLENVLTAHTILARDISRDNCFETAIKLFSDIPKNVRFLSPGEDVKYYGILCSSHGHQGVNGARGSLKSLEKVYGKLIIGHVHKLEMLRKSMSVGTSTKIPLEYQKGFPSSSMAGNGVIYEGGLMQAIPIVKGKWAKEDILSFLNKNRK